MYKLGDLVVVKIASIITQGESKKLLSKWKGPFKIIKRLPRDRYEVTEIKALNPGRKYTGVYSAEHVKPWFLCNFDFEEMNTG